MSALRGGAQLVSTTSLARSQSHDGATESMGSYLTELELMKKGPVVVNQGDGQLPARERCRQA
jgi:hypothetical protein